MSGLTGNLWGEQVVPLEGVDDPQGFQSAVVVADQGVHPEQADQAEVPHDAQHVGALLVALRCVEVLLTSCTPTPDLSETLCLESLYLSCGIAFA